MKSLLKLILVSSILLFQLNQLSAQYTWKNVTMGGGGFVSAVITCPTEKNLIYCRTDVGGAYKWVDATKSWLPLTDWVSDSQVGFLGVESIAIDPSAPAKVYMLVGIDYFNSGKSAILRSTDYGTTFATTEVTSQFKAHGNGMGRANGERLAVDPNKGSILFCGTRRNGLFKSTDSGVTWSSVPGLPVTTTPNDNGICFVVFDKSTGTTGNATQTIYAGISRMGSTNMYVSKDGGTTWNAIAGQTTTYMPQRAIIASDGMMYVTYGNGAGPSGHWNVAAETMDNGQVWKYNTKTPGWTNITPVISGVNMAFAGVSVDATTPTKVIVTTTNKYLSQPWGWGDRIFVSTNSGGAWTDLIANNKVAMSNGGQPWIDNHAIHWAGSIEIDPYNSERVFLTSGNGIFMTENLSAATSTWTFTCKGLEETVPLDLVSIPAGPLVSVIGDYDGSTYTNILTSTPTHNPGVGTTTGVTYASKNTSYIVRVGGADDGTNFPIYYSNNTGSTWSAFATKPAGTPRKGLVGVSADGLVTLWCPDASTTTYRTANNGSTWTNVTGINFVNAPTADQVNISKMYAYNPNTGYVFVSTNKGVSFTQGGLAGTNGANKIRTAPGVEGDIWVPLYDNGLTRSTNSGTSFTKLTNVTKCSAVGFGKIASGKTYPTIFIWGTVGGVVGIFKSTDTGANWTRVNDNTHQFGGPANGQFVIGDMNVEGRVYMSTAGRGIVYGEPASASACKVPNLGADVTVCGQTFPYTLNSGTTVQTNVTYKWYKNGSIISGATAATYSIPSATGAAATYTVQRDSATCSQTDNIIVTAVLPVVNLGVDQELCALTSAALDAGVVGTGITYQWQKNATNILGATAKTYTATSAGTYKCTVSATGCTAVSDDIIITSKLLSVTPDTVCATGGVASLAVTTVGGPFEWYNVATNGTALLTGATYSPTIAATTTYYVKDAGGVSSSIGKATQDAGFTGWYTNTFANLENQHNVTVTQAITLESVSVYVQTAGANVTIRFMQGTTVAYTYTATNVAAGLQVIPVNFALVPGSYVMDAIGTSNSLYLQNNNGSFPYSLSGYISFTNAQSWAGTYYGMFYDWKLKAGNSCARTPVVALVDAATPCSDTQAPTTPGTISFSATTTTGMTATWTASTDNIAVTGYEVYINGVLNSTVTTNSITLTGLTCNTAYTLKVRAKDAASNFSAYTADAINTTSSTALPTVTTPILYCQGVTATALTATGTALKWYTVATGGTGSATSPIPSTTAAGTTTYYVSQTLNSCESARAIIDVTIAPKPVPISSISSTDVDTTLCPAGSTVLTTPTTQANATDFDWTWYKGSVAAGNIVSGPTGASTAPSFTVTYANPATYILLVRAKLFPTLTACQNQKAITITSVAAPTYTITGSGTTCEGGSVPTVTVNLTGTQPFTFTWSQLGTVNSTITQNNVLANSFVLPQPSSAGTYNYTLTALSDKYCSGTITTANASITINAIPVAPTVISPMSYPQGATATALTATGTGLLWYSVATGGTGSATAPIPSTATIGTANYYVSQTVNGCESNRSQIGVNIVTATVTQTITLQSGWNLISTYVTPTDKTIATLFASVDYTLIKNADGFYKKGQTGLLQSITTFEPGQAYLIYINTPTTISITGTALASYTATLKQGWNMLGYPVATAKATTTVLAPIWTNTQSIKNFDDFLDHTSGTLNTLTPGQGYYIYMNSAGTLSF